MKRTSFISVAVLLLLVLLIPGFLGAKPTLAQTAEYTIQNVDHQIEIMYSGNIVVRDIVTLSDQATGGFLIGFPYKYGASLLKAVAFSSNQIYPINLGVRLGNQSGFYGAEVTFPQGASQVFTVVFIFSNNLLTRTSDGFSFDFPAYPSLAKPTSKCNVTLVLPGTSTFFNVTKADGIVYAKSFVKDNLPPLASFPATAYANFPTALVRQISVTSLNRVVSLGPAGEITVTDNYRIVNNSTLDITSIRLEAPINASNINGKDDFGRTLPIQLLSDTSNPNAQPVNVTLLGILQSGQAVGVEIDYNLPTLLSGKTLLASDIQLFPHFSYYIFTVSISVTPPEGAHIVSPNVSSADPQSSLDRELFQETLKISREGLSYVDRDVPGGNTLQIAYNYNPLWISLRPTLWVWAIAGVGIVVGVFMQRRRKPQGQPKIQAGAKISISSRRDNVRAFVDAYEERKKISEELKTLISKAQKGKIPRRQYKVQRRALELRYNSLSKQINELKIPIRNAGGNQASLIKQLESAESELTKVEANINTAEARRRTGELPLEEYKQTTEDLRKRKEKTETAVEGILLRIREEIR